MKGFFQAPWCFAACYAAQTVEKPLILGRAAFLAPFRRSQRSQEMLRHKALGLCPKPRQGPEAPAPALCQQPVPRATRRF